MPSSQLPNYLLANRKRLALSQREVAFLLGIRRTPKVCEDERFIRPPGLEEALAYEVIYQRSVSELFGGLYQQVEKQVAERAKILTYRKDGRAKQRVARKREVLSNMAALESKTQH
jgi:hypothetical protein